MCVCVCVALSRIAITVECSPLHVVPARDTKVQHTPRILAHGNVCFVRGLCEQNGFVPLFVAIEMATIVTYTDSFCSAQPLFSPHKVRFFFAYCHGNGDFD